MGKSSTSLRPRICLVLFIFTLLIAQVTPQSQNDEMEEAELSTKTSTTPATHSSTHKTTSTTPPTTMAPTTPPSTDKPYPHNILRAEVYSDPSTNNSCIIFQGALQLSLNSSSLFGKHAILTMDVPVDATATGICGNLTQTLILDWNDYNVSHKIKREYSLELQFGFGKTNNKQYVIEEVILYVTTFNATTDQKELLAIANFDAQGPFYPVDLLQSYLCVSNSMITGSNLTMLTSSLQFEAFRPKSATPHQFSPPHVCSLDNSTAVTMIGIAVGSVLVLLLAIGFGSYVGIRYGYCNWPSCCNRDRGGYQRLDI